MMGRMKVTARLPYGKYRFDEEQHLWLSVRIEAPHIESPGLNASASELQIKVRPAAGARVRDVVTRSFVPGTGITQVVDVTDEGGGVRMRLPDLLSEEVLELHLNIDLEPRTQVGRVAVAFIEGRYLSMEGYTGMAVEKRIQLQVDVERVSAPEEQRERRLRRIELLELDVKDLENAPHFGDYVVENMAPLHLNQKSPLPGDDRHFATIDMQVRNYRVSRTEKYRLQRYLFAIGVVAKTTHGWLFIKDGAPLRAATPEDIETLPHLPDDWEALAINVP